MILRWLVGNLVRQAAEKKVYDAVAHASQALHRFGSGTEAGTASPSELPVPCDIALAFASGVEAGGLVDLLGEVTTTYCASFVERIGRCQEQAVAVIETGEGAETAAKALSDLVSLQRPKWIVSAGFCGSLHADLRPGHVLMADSIADQHGHRFAVGMKIDPQVVAASRGLHVGRLLTVDRLVHQAAERQSLAQQHDALACDQESAAIAELCQRERIRFLSVRVVTDAVDDELPPEITSLLEQKSLASKLGAAAATIFGRPGSVKDLWHLREQALKASDRLGKFLIGVVPQLQVDS